MSGLAVQAGKRVTYPAYKPSGIEWVQEIPAEWNVASLRWISRRYAGGTPDRQNLDYWCYGTIPWINSGAVNQWRITEYSALITEQGYRESSTKWIPEGALVMALAGQGKTKGMVAQAGMRVCCNQSMAAICPTGRVKAKYLLWWLNSQYSRIRGLAGDTQRDGLNLDIVGSIPCLLPNPDEQKAIVAFLDWETARIDALIEKKRRQIELLQEKRSALISHAVTKGLDSNAPMKDSGIEWLGDVPEPWEILRLKFALWLQRGHDLPVADVVDGPYPVQGSNGCIGQHNQFTTRGPGVTVGRSGSVGAVNFVDGDFWAHNTALYVKEFRRCEPKFAFYLIKTLDVGHLSEGTAVGTLNRNYIHELLVALPTEDEQKAIAAFLDRETARIDALATKIQTSIDTLREHRTTLISAAVTGKIDVREEEG